MEGGRKVKVCEDILVFWLDEKELGPVEGCKCCIYPP